MSHKNIWKSNNSLFSHKNMGIVELYGGGGDFSWNIWCFKFIFFPLSVTLRCSFSFKCSIRVRINFSKLHREKLYEKKLLVLLSCKGPQWLGLRVRIFWNFFMLWIFQKNAISKCKLRLFESLKYPHLKMKNIYGTRKT